MKILNEKKLSQIKADEKEQTEIKLADIYEILLNLDDRLTAIENKLNGGAV